MDVKISLPKFSFLLLTIFFFIFSLFPLFFLFFSSVRITNAPIGDVFVVWAKLDGKVNGFVVERGFGGVTTDAYQGSEEKERKKKKKSGENMANEELTIFFLLSLSLSLFSFLF